MTTSNHDDRQVSNGDNDSPHQGLMWASGFGAGTAVSLLALSAAALWAPSTAEPFWTAAGGGVALLFSIVYWYLAFWEPAETDKSDKDDQLATDGGQTVETELQILQCHDVSEYGHDTVHKLANVDGETDEEALPSAVSKSLADHVWAEFGIDVEDHGIEVHDEGNHA